MRSCWDFKCIRLSFFNVVMIIPLASEGVLVEVRCLLFASNDIITGAGMLCDLHYHN
jgi:hypothetical protein